MAGDGAPWSTSPTYVSIDAERTRGGARAEKSIPKRKPSQTRESQVKTAMRIEKRLALRLVKHAEFVLPGSLSAWGIAMRNEIEYIEPNRDALKWALGCVSASYLQRIAYLNVVQITVIRWLLSAFIGTWALDNVLAARFFYLKSIVWLGLALDTGETAKFFAALSTVPSWSLVFDGAAGLFYISAAYCLVRKKIASLWMLVAGTSLNGIACASQVMAYLAQFGAAPPESLRHIYITYALHFCVILLLCHAFARGQSNDNGQSAA